jgi:farnesyl diphosphate synthase
MKTLKEWRALIDRQLLDVVASTRGESEVLKSAAMYVVAGQGKRLRGLLTMAIEHDCAGTHRACPTGFVAALAAEILHAASLVHDDLPALDNDDFRRGRPSCHRAFTEATAILTGDYLIGRAFSLVCEGDIAAVRQGSVTGTLARAWGDLCMGQQLDIERSHEAHDPEIVMRLKTGALFGASAMCGALCAGLDEKTTTAFYSWGERVGVLFQKLDDIDDGDGPQSGAFDKGRETQALLAALQAIRPQSMPTTELVYRLIVGDVSVGD